MATSGTVIIINCAQVAASLITKKGAVKKKNCVFVSTSRSHEQNGFRESYKLYLNLRSRKWLRPRFSLVRYLIPLQLWQLKALFGDGLINFNKFFLKTLRLVTIRGPGSSLFHSITLDGKKFLFSSYVM